MGWYRAASRGPLCKAVVNPYRAHWRRRAVRFYHRQPTVRPAQAWSWRRPTKVAAAGLGGLHGTGARRGAARRAPGELAGSPPGGTIDSV